MERHNYTLKTSIAQRRVTQMVNMQLDSMYIHISLESSTVNIIFCANSLWVSLQMLLPVQVKSIIFFLKHVSSHPSAVFLETSVGT